MACGENRRASSSLERPLRQIGVRTDPGSTSETDMPLVDSSMRMASATALNANLDALYAAMNGTANRPETEPTKTMRPRCARKVGRNACETATAPKTLTSNCRRKSSMGRNSRGPVTATPALLTSPRSESPLERTARAEVSVETGSLTYRRMGRISSWRAASLAASASFLTPANTTQPSRGNNSPVAAPMPLDAPVTTTADRCIGRPSPLTAVRSIRRVGMPRAVERLFVKVGLVVDDIARARELRMRALFRQDVLPPLEAYHS